MQPWDTYWSNNSQGDCFSLDGKSKLSQVLFDYWCEYFQHKGQGVRVLDLACGNGFVGKCAIHSATNLLAIGADNVLDIGQTEFQVESNNSRLKILTGIDIGQLKFAENEFDFIVSQFGLEYSDFASVIKTTVKQLKTNGEMNFILHNSGSELCQQSQTEVTLLNYLIDEISIFEKIAELNEKNGQKANNTLSDITEEVTNKGLLLVGNNKALFWGVFSHIKELIDKFLSSNKVRIEEVNFIEQHYRTHRDRLQQQLSVAMDQNKLAQLVKIIDGCGMQDITQCVFKHEESGLIGWQVKANKKCRGKNKD